MKNWLQIDEQTDALSGRIAVIFLGLTHIALFLSLVLQRYLQDRPPEYYNDVAIILALSWLGFWGTCLFMGGFLPTLTFPRLLAIYLLIVLSIGIPHTILHGWPEADEWFRRVLAIFVVPAIFVGLYALTAYLGKKRLDKMISSDV